MQRQPPFRMVNHFLRRILPADITVIAQNPLFPALSGTFLRFFMAGATVCWCRISSSPAANCEALNNLSNDSGQGGVWHHFSTGSFTVTSFGRVISVRGSQARIGILATNQIAAFDIRATVGRFISIHCPGATVVAIIAEVSSEGLADAGSYVATASVALLGENKGPAEKLKIKRG